ncbi:MULTISPECIES: AMMECR1 domain-containing protein [Sulfurimonas]|uniref:AMMECR1 domain-containing protein n=1 Tax=Sulfurimonas TaxID=202746 RepID=UPI0012646657|nr:AMMECR1 domain-containing protein [Sulfurimonas indica]
MNHPLLIQLAHDSIIEVLQSKNSIDKKALLKEYPLLGETLPITLKIFLDDELRGYYEDMAHLSLLDNIVVGAKKAAFEDINFTPLTLSEYFEIEIEISLQTPEGVISHRA